MVGLTDVVIVTLLAAGATVLVGVLGYWIDKNADPPEHEAERKRA